MSKGKGEVNTGFEDVNLNSSHDSDWEKVSNSGSDGDWEKVNKSETESSNQQSANSLPNKSTKPLSYADAARKGNAAKGKE